MMDCWTEVPEHRPTFTDLVNRLELLLTPPQEGGSGGGGSRPTSREPTYLNVHESQYLKPVDGGRV